MLGKFQHLINASMTARPSNDDDFGLFGTAICEEDEFAFGPFSVRVFLRHVTLDVSLNASAVRRDTLYGNFDRPSALEVSYEIADNTASGARQEHDLSVGTNATAGIEFGTAARLVDERSINLGQRATYTAIHPLVRFSGSEEVLRWTFQPAPHERYLFGTLLNEAQLCKFEKGQEPVRANIGIPKHGVFTSPSRYSNVREQRRLNIFALLVRKSISGRHPVTVHICDKSG